MRYLASALCLLLLVGLVAFGCGEKTELQKPEPSFEVIATIPHTGQFNVPPGSYLYVLFPEKPDLPSAAIRVMLELVNGDTSEKVDTLLDQGGDSIIIKPNVILKEGKKYRIKVLAGIVSAKDKKRVTSKSYQFEFTTLRHRPDSQNPPEVVSFWPNTEDECFDIATFRLFFSEPIDPLTVVKGASFGLKDTKTGSEVEGTLIAWGTQVVFDPDKDLDPDKEYELWASGINDYNGQAMAKKFSFKFTPIDTNPRVGIYVANCPTAAPNDVCVPVSPDALPAHRIVGLGANSMFARGTLMGNNFVYLGGRNKSEMGDTSKFPDKIPIVIRKGQKLSATEIVALLGGKIPLITTNGTPVTTGSIDLQFLTDVVGYISSAKDVFGVEGGRASIRLFMDVAMTASDVGAASSFDQPMLGNELTGITDVNKEFGELEMDLAGLTEMRVVDEFMPVVVAAMQIATTGGEGGGNKEGDNTPPSVIITNPLPNSQLVEQSEKIILTFSEPLDPKTVEGKLLVSIYGGTPIEGQELFWQNKLVFKPNQPLPAGEVIDVNLAPGVADLAGNATTESYDFTFSVGGYESSPTEPPLLNSVTPSDKPNSEMCAEFAVETYFSQLMDPATINYGTSFVVRDLSDQTVVPGMLYVNWKRLRFVPDDWFVPGHVYQVEVDSSIANLDGVPLDTDADGTAGGPKVTWRFTAVESQHWVQSVMYTEPFADRNEDAELTGNEYPTDTNYFDILPSLVDPAPSYAYAYLPLNVKPAIQDPTYTWRVPIDLVSGIKIFATSTSIEVLGYPLLSSGRITSYEAETGRSDGILGTDGFADLDVYSKNTMKMEDSLLDSLLGDEVVLAAIGDLAIRPDGRMFVNISTTSNLSFLGGLMTMQMDVELRLVTYAQGWDLIF